MSLKCVIYFRLFMVLDLVEIFFFVRVGVYYVKMFRIEYKFCMNSLIIKKKSYCYDDK